MTILTPAQQAELDRQAKLGQARVDYQGDDLDVSGYGAEKATVQRLAEKIAWLEQEVLDLRAKG